MVFRLFESVVNSGKHLAIMAHFSHTHELQTAVAQEAIRRILMTGATIRAQAPLINHVNADPKIWTDMWRLQVNFFLCLLFLQFLLIEKTYDQLPVGNLNIR